MIIALSASGRGDVNIKMKRAGISAYVSKPFNPIELQEVMVHYLRGNKDNNTTINVNEEAALIKEEMSSSVKSNKLNHSSINLGKYLELAKGNTTILNKLVNNSLQSIKNLRNEILSIEPNENGDKLGNLIHKNTMTLHYLEANILTRQLKDFKYALQNKKEKQIRELKSAVNGELENIINELEDLDV